MSSSGTVDASAREAEDARPTALQIVHNESLQGKLKGKVIVITGGASGIGLETTQALATTGATLLLTARDLQKAKASLANMEQDNISLIEMENSSLESVRAAAAAILAKSNNQVNILIENAGVLGIQERILTDDGFETHFITNHLSHFLLFELLKPALLASSTSELPSRVVVVSSSSHRSGDLNESDNYNFEKGGYDFETAYAQSKLANVYMANELDRRYGNKGLHGLSLHPGNIGTGLARHFSKEWVEAYVSSEKFKTLTMKSPEQGAATTVYAAISKAWHGRGGRYLEDCGEAKRGEDDRDGLGAGYVSQTYNPELEKRLWKDSLAMVGLEDDL